MVFFRNYLSFRKSYSLRFFDSLKGRPPGGLFMMVRGGPVGTPAPAYASTPTVRSSFTQSRYPCRYSSSCMTAMVMKSCSISSRRF